MAKGKSDKTEHGESVKDTGPAAGDADLGTREAAREAELSWPPGDSTAMCQGGCLKVVVGGNVLGYFSECSGIGSASHIVEHAVVDREGREVIRKIAGRLEWHNVTLTRGITNDMTVWQWRRQVVEGNVRSARVPVVITLLDKDGAAVATWQFLRAWPVDVEGYSTEDGCFLETLTIVHEGMLRTDGG